MGAPRKPAKIREIEGNRSRTPIPKEVNGRGLPQPPKTLNKAELELWHHVCESLPLGLLTSADEAALERMAVSWARWRACQANIRKNGLMMMRTVTVGRNKVRVERVNPMVELQQKAAREMHSCGEILGLSPVARTRLSADPTGEADPLELLLDGRRDGAYYAPAPKRKEPQGE